MKRIGADEERVFNWENPHDCQPNLSTRNKTVTLAVETCAWSSLLSL